MKIIGILIAVFKCTSVNMGLDDGMRLHMVWFVAKIFLAFFGQKSSEKGEFKLEKQF